MSSAGGVAVGVGVAESNRGVGTGACDENASVCNYLDCGGGGGVDPTRYCIANIVGIANVGVV